MIHRKDSRSETYKTTLKNIESDADGLENLIDLMIEDRERIDEKYVEINLPEYYPRVLDIVTDRYRAADWGVELSTVDGIKTLTLWW